MSFFFIGFPFVTMTESNLFGIYQEYPRLCLIQRWTERVSKQAIVPTQWHCSKDAVLGFENEYATLSFAIAIEL